MNKKQFFMSDAEDFGKCLKDALETMEHAPLFKELPDHLKELATQNISRQGKELNPDKQIISCFDFMQSKEGQEFWIRIAQKKYDTPIPAEINSIKPGEAFEAFREMLLSLGKIETVPNEEPSNEFKNGEKVEVYHYPDEKWIPGKFIGKDGNIFIVKTTTVNGYDKCRKQQTKIKDSNLFVKPQDEEDRGKIIQNLKHLSVQLFDNNGVIQLLEGCTPMDRPELKHRALFIPDKFRVESGSTPLGTYISIQNK